MTELYKDEHGGLYALIPFDSNMPKEDIHNGLVIDEDIKQAGVDGKLYLVKAGTYLLNNEIVKGGCYKVPLIEISK